MVAHRTGMVYHWKHGWIPLDHAAAMSKAKGNKAAAKHMLGAVPREHLRRESHIVAARRGGRIVLHDKKTGHSLGVNEGHLASFHSQGHTIIGVQDGSFTTRAEDGKKRKYDRNGWQINP